MSKFEGVAIHGGNNQVGDNNVQHNVTNNNNNFGNNGGSSGEDNIFPLLIGAVFALGVFVWWFFGHIDDVYHYLKWFAGASAVLSFLSIFISIFSGAIEGRDVIRCITSVFIALALFGLAVLSRVSAPDDVVSLSQHATVSEFWSTLTAHGNRVAISTAMSALLIAASAIAAHLGSMRQFAYSLASPNASGFWYLFYANTELFKMRFVLSFNVFFSAFAWAAISGKLPGL